MKKNIDRVSKLLEAVVEGGKFIQSCFDWESKLRSSAAFAVSFNMAFTFASVLSL